jgi:hypothetical protein
LARGSSSSEARQQAKACFWTTFKPLVGILGDVDGRIVPVAGACSFELEGEPATVCDY